MKTASELSSGNELRKPRTFGECVPEYNRFTRVLPPIEVAKYLVEEAIVKATFELRKQVRNPSRARFGVPPRGVGSIIIFKQEFPGRGVVFQDQFAIRGDRIPKTILDKAFDSVLGQEVTIGAVDPSFFEDEQYLFDVSYARHGGPYVDVSRIEKLDGVADALELSRGALTKLLRRINCLANPDDLDEDHVIWDSGYGSYSAGPSPRFVGRQEKLRPVLLPLTGTLRPREYAGDFDRQSRLVPSLVDILREVRGKFEEYDRAQTLK